MDHQAEAAHLMSLLRGGEPEGSCPEGEAILAKLRSVHVLDPDSYNADDAAAITEHLPVNHVARVRGPRGNPRPWAS